jgi:hypothetical protein
LRVPPSFLECLGLQKDTPIEKVQKSNIEEKIKKVGLLDWLSTTANVSIVTQVLFINL